MKTQDLENIRKAEIIAVFTAAAFSTYNINIPNLNNDIFLDITQMLYIIDIYTSFRTYKLTSDYKEIKELYDQVIKRTGDLARDFNFKDPIEIFSMFVYLYRNGYLSYNGEFTYNFDLKDMPGIYGADVIRGKGVCRSISSMMVDLYTELGFNTTNLSVCATRESIKNLQKVCDTPMKKASVTPEFMKIFMNLTVGLRMGNHLITQVNHNGYNYLLDPTNDGMLRYDETSKHFYSGSVDNAMYYVRGTQIIQNILGSTKTSSLHTGFDNQIDEETYKEIYTRTLQFLKSNMDYIQEFVMNNESLYRDIFNLVDDQRSLIGKVFPIVPRKSTIERIRTSFKKDKIIF